MASLPADEETHVRRIPAVLALAVALSLPATAALAASGSLSDPDDDSLVDVLKLSYANKDAKAVVKMTYDGYRPQTENFYVKWGSDGKYYKLQHSPNGTRLWFSNGSGETEKTCDGDKVSYDADSYVSTGVVPRSCMPKAPDSVKFQGIATEGLYEMDKTKTSAAVDRG